MDLFGWIFALAVIALFKTSISIIVVGVGSVTGDTRLVYVGETEF